MTGGGWGPGGGALESEACVSEVWIECPSCPGLPVVGVASRCGPGKPLRDGPVTLGFPDTTEAQDVSQGLPGVVHPGFFGPALRQDHTHSLHRASASSSPPNLIRKSGGSVVGSVARRAHPDADPALITPAAAPSAAYCLRLSCQWWPLPRLTRQSPSVLEQLWG